ncbi:MAG: c-type cytochrome biogenesis protein CcmI/CycH [Myxococcota bacterium]
MTTLRLLALVLALVALPTLGCDRNVEPFDAAEQPRQPDLSKIFPKGAERAAMVEPGLPAPPGAGRGAPSLAQEAAAAGTAGGDAAPITGTIRLGAGVTAPIPDGAILFLIARRGEAGPPLAVKRIPSPRLPLDFSVGPEDRMIQAMPFEGPLRITARIDGDGNASSRTPGDLQGQAEGVYEPGASGVDVVIDEVL